MAIVSENNQTLPFEASPIHDYHSHTVADIGYRCLGKGLKPSYTPGTSSLGNFDKGVFDAPSGSNLELDRATQIPSTFNMDAYQNLACHMWLSSTNMK